MGIVVTSLPFWRVVDTDIMRKGYQKRKETWIERDVEPTKQTSTLWKGEARIFVWFSRAGWTSPSYPVCLSTLLLSD